MGRTALAFFITLGLSAASAVGSVIHVDDSAGPGGDGLSWSGALRHLNDALDLAAQPVSTITEIRIAGGLYRPDSGAGRVAGDRLAVFELVTGVDVLGGYAGVGAADPDVRDPETWVTVLDGDLLGDDLPGLFFRNDNSVRVMNAIGTTDVLIEGMLFRGAHADNLDSHGGALYCDSAEVTIRLCRFVENRSASGAGGIGLHVASSAVIESCEFRNNWSNSGAAAISVRGDSVFATIESCLFVGNESQNRGALYVSSTTATLRDSVFRNNIGSNGVCCYLSGNAFGTPTLTVERCRFIENEAGNRGGALYAVTGAAWSLDSCLFLNNTAGSGGALAHGNVTPSVLSTVTRCEFIGNTAGRGGVLFNIDGGHQFNSCLFLNNSATNLSGGVSYHHNGGAMYRSCTMVGNTAVGGGSVFHNGASIQIFNGVVHENGPEPIQGGASILFTNIDGGWPGSGNFDADPIFANFAVGNARLRPDSPSIDAGIGGGSSTDLDGAARVVDGDGDGVITIDQGAYEYAFQDCNGNGTDDLDDIAAGEVDCNVNGIPDTCETITDCDGNGIDDECDLADGALDCNLNGVIDMCELATNDCDGNGIPDDCDIVAGALDCDHNGLLDVCELDAGAPDCNLNGLVDACDLIGNDCNDNGIPDDCDVASGHSEDADGDGIPDECQCFADFDQDGQVSYADLLTLLSYWNNCNGCPADLNDDGLVDMRDLMALLAAWGPCGGA